MALPTKTQAQDPPASGSHESSPTPTVQSEINSDPTPLATEDSPVNRAASSAQSNWSGGGCQSSPSQVVQLKFYNCCTKLKKKVTKRQVCTITLGPDPNSPYGIGYSLSCHFETETSWKCVKKAVVGSATNPKCKKRPG